MYIKPGGRNSVDVAYLASTDGCIHNELPGIKGGSVHMTEASLLDGSYSGVIIWSEDPDDGIPNVDHLRRADFTVNAAGALTDLDIIEDPLDLGDPGVPDGDTLGYGFPDVWGNGTHDELYMLVNRGHSDQNSGGSHSLRIYNLNDLSDSLELFWSVDFPGGYTSSWPCPESTTHPEAVAGCYRPESFRWNPTGTAIYIQDTIYSPDSVRWNGAIRLQITRGGPVSSWGVSAPQIVYTGSTNEVASEPNGLAAMPRPVEFVGVGDLILAGDNNNVTATTWGMLNVEACITAFTPPVSNPDPEIDPNLWLTCLVDTDPYTGEEFDLGDADRAMFGYWLSPNEILHEVREKRRLVSIYKTNVHSGISTKLVDDAEDPDSGK